MHHVNRSMNEPWPREVLHQCYHFEVAAPTKPCSSASGNLFVKSIRPFLINCHQHNVPRILLSVRLSGLRRWLNCPSKRSPRMWTVVHFLRRWLNWRLYYQRVTDLRASHALGCALACHIQYGAWSSSRNVAIRYIGVPYTVPATKLRPLRASMHALLTTLALLVSCVSGAFFSPALLALQEVQGYYNPTLGEGSMLDNGTSYFRTRQRHQSP